MKLWNVNSGKFRVLSVTDERKGKTISPALDFLANCPSDLSGQANGIKATFARYAQYGQDGLTFEMFHDAGGDGISEFRRGRLRVYCFKDGSDLVILSHGALKKSGRRGNKTATADLTAAESAKARYLAAKTANQITIEEVPKDE